LGNLEYLDVFASFKNEEPSELNHDFSFSNQHKIIIEEKISKAPNPKDRFKIKLKSKQEQVDF
jgi:hypothetical protein